MTQREFDEKLGASTSWLSNYLKALIDRGWVKVKNFIQNKNKFGYIYVINPAGIVERAMLAGRFNKPKMAEGDALKAEIGTLDSESAIYIDPVTSKK